MSMAVALTRDPQGLVEIVFFCCFTIHHLDFRVKVTPDVLTLYAAILPSSWCRGGNRGAHGA